MGCLRITIQAGNAVLGLSGQPCARTVQGRYNDIDLVIQPSGHLDTGCLQLGDNQGLLIGAQSLEGLDQNGGLDGHVETAHDLDAFEKEGYDYVFEGEDDDFKVEVDDE